MFFLIERLKPVSLFLLALGIFLLAGPLPVDADNFTVAVTFTDMGELDTDHDDSELPEDEWMGSMELTVTNNTSVAWGDFHFGISSGDATFDSTINPSWDHGDGLSWEFSAGDTVLDLEFYTNPVAIDDTVTFTVYTDNTATGGLFGVCFYPTPVPIPSAVWLLGSGLIGMIGFRRKCRE